MSNMTGSAQPSYDLRLAQLQRISDHIPTFLRYLGLDVTALFCRDISFPRGVAIYLLGLPWWFLVFSQKFPRSPCWVWGWCPASAHLLSVLSIWYFNLARGERGPWFTPVALNSPLDLDPALTKASYLHVQQVWMVDQSRGVTKRLWSCQIL